MFAYYEWLILVFPLLGTLILFVAGRRTCRRLQNGIAIGSVAGPLIIALPLLIGQSLEPGLVGKPDPLPWIQVWTGTGYVSAPFLLLIDALSVFALYVVTVGLLWIVLNAIRPQPGEDRHLDLVRLTGLLATLLIAVLADNLIFLLLGWSLSGWILLDPFGSDDTDAKEKHRGFATALLLISDFMLLLAAGVANKQFASLSLYHIFALEPARMLDEIPQETISAITALLVGGALVRTAQAPFHGPPVACEQPAYLRAVWELVHTLPGVYLVTRIYPLLQQVPAAEQILTWWGVASALLLAAVAAVQPESHHSRRWVSQGQGGLMLAALGLRLYHTAMAFLPAYVLAHILAQFSGPRERVHSSARARTAEHPSPWLHAFAWAATCGFPLLSGYFLIVRLYGAAYGDSLGVWALMLVATLLLAASGSRAIKQIHFREKTDPPFGHGSLILLALLVVALGVLNLLSQSPIETLLTPIFGPGWSPPGWWWHGLAVLVAALGTVLGFAIDAWLERPAPKTISWIARGYDTQRIYERAVTGPLQAAGTFLAETVEPFVERWTFGALGRLISRQTPQDRDPPPSVPTATIMFILGIVAVAVYLLVR